ncbi:MAG: hypothetical protein WCP53_00285 [Verrucomicrobiota bacterium]
MSASPGIAQMRSEAACYIQTARESSQHQRRPDISRLMNKHNLENIDCMHWSPTQRTGLPDCGVLRPAFKAGPAEVLMSTGPYTHAGWNVAQANAARNVAPAVGKNQRLEVRDNETALLGLVLRYVERRLAHGDARGLLSLNRRKHRAALRNAGFGSSDHGQVRRAKPLILCHESARLILRVVKNVMLGCIISHVNVDHTSRTTGHDVCDHSPLACLYTPLLLSTGALFDWVSDFYFSSLFCAKKRRKKRGRSRAFGS